MTKGAMVRLQERAVQTVEENIGRTSTAARDREICELLLRTGKPLREIAPQYGLSAERVRQIRDAGGVTQEEIERVRHEARSACLLDHRDEILRRYRSGLSLEEISEGLPFSHKTLAQKITSMVTERDTMARRRSQAQRKQIGPSADRAELIDHLHRAAGEIEDAAYMSQDAYERVAGRLGLRPSSGIVGVFGTWRSALEAADLPGVPPTRRVYQQVWPKERCEAFVRAYAREHRTWPTSQRYAQISSGRKDMPSPRTLRLRLGRWENMYALALEELD